MNFLAAASWKRSGSFAANQSVPVPVSQQQSLNLSDSLTLYFSVYEYFATLHRSSNQAITVLLD